MKSKIVIEVQMPCDKCRTKAMKIAASTYGVESVALQGDDKKQLVVTGEVDSVNLTKTLRKKIGRAVIVEQGEAKKKEDKKKEEESKILWQPRPPVLVYHDQLESNPNTCSII